MNNKSKAIGILDNIRQALMTSGIKDAKIAILESKINGLADDNTHLKTYLDWLLELEQIAREYQDAYNLLSPDKWNYYKLMGLTDMREQLILKDASKKLHMCWTHEPKFRKSRAGKTHVAKGTDIESEIPASKVND